MSGSVSLMALAWRFIKRDWRRREMLTLFFSLLLAMTSGSVIFLVISQMQAATAREAASALGADMVLTSPRQVDVSWLQRARDLELEVASSIEFASVVSNQHGLQLSAIKAISKNYPLRGYLEIAEKPYAVTKVVTGAPKKANIWLAPRTFNRLKLSKGDRVELGATTFLVAGSIALEPSQGSTLFTVAPSAIINVADLPATEVLQPGSRVTYRYLFAGDAGKIKAFAAWLADQIDNTQRIVNLLDESPLSGSASQRASSYFALSGVLTLLLLAVAIALSAQRYASRQLDVAALMRCLGLARRQVVMVYSLILTIIAILGISLGAVWGSLFFLLLKQWLTGFIDASSVSVDFTQLVWPALTTSVLLFGVAFPALMTLFSVSPIRVLRHQVERSSWQQRVMYLLTLFSIGLVLWLQVGDLQLLLRVVGTLLLLLIAFSALGLLLLRVGRFLIGQNTPVARFSLRQLQYQKAATLIHLVSFSTVLFVMLLLIWLRTELLGQWQQQISSDKPNHFLVNLPVDGKDKLNKMLAEAGIQSALVYPMVRGRISHIKGESVQSFVERTGSNHNSLRRELNLTWSAQLPEGNQVVKGQWGWPQSDLPAISLEQATADALQLQPGDTLTFDIGGTSWQVVIANIRHIDWQTLTPNFYVIAEPGSLDSFYATAITSIYLSPQQKHILAEISRTFPMVSIIELDKVFAEIAGIVDKVSLAVELVMSFVIGAGLMLLWATMAQSFSLKLKQAAILRALGASQAFIRSVFRFEYVWLAIIASLVALCATELSAYLVYQGIFDINARIHYPWWLVTPAFMLTFMLLSSRRAVSHIAASPPNAILRGEF